MELVEGSTMKEEVGPWRFFFERESVKGEKLIKEKDRVYI